MNALSPKLSSQLLQERMYSGPDLRGGLATLTKVVDLLPFQNSVSVAEEIWRDASKQFSLAGRCFNDRFQGFKRDHWRRDGAEVSSSAQGLKNTALVELDISGVKKEESWRKNWQKVKFLVLNTPAQEKYTCGVLLPDSILNPPLAPYAFDRQTWPPIPHNVPPSPSLAWLTAVKRKPETEAILMADQRSSITRSGVV